jgi:DNA mismatch endonuclease (patch repair protein)
MALRRLLHAAGLRYRVEHRVPGLPRRTVDIALPGRRLAVFVDGCFWHGCPDHSRPPRSNTDWWVAKLAANRERDRSTTAHLEAAGWTVLRIWEHEDPRAAADRVLLAAGRPSPVP